MRKKKACVKSSLTNNHSPIVDSNHSECLQSIAAKPSPELLNYYKNKASRIEREFDDLSDLVDNVKSACDLSAGLQSELNLRNEEVHRLQQIVSDLQVHLYREREQSLRLSGENDKFRIKEFENRKKIDMLLSLSGTTHKELLYFISTNPKALVVPQKLPPKLQKLKESKGKNGIHIDAGSQSDSEVSYDPQVLILKNHSLAAQLEHHINISRDQVQALLKDRELAIEERQIERSRLQRDVDTLSSKLKRTQDNLCETTARLVKCQQEYERNRNFWMEEKEKFNQVLTSLKDSCEVVPEVVGHFVSNVATSRTRSCCESELLKEQFIEKEQLAVMYQEQVVALEAEVSRLKERAETCRNMFREKTQKMSAQVSYLKNKYEDLDRRRLLEAEGFRTDIRMLRERLKELEKKLAKGNFNHLQPSEQHVLVSSARNTLNRARQLEKELTNIKTKIATLEVSGVD